MKQALIFILSVVTWLVHGQDCLSGNISMSDNDVANFPINYPNCTNIVGDILIDNCTSLAGFSQLDQWDGTLYLRNGDFTDLHGLHNIDTFGGLYILGSMSPLTNIDHISQIKHVSQYLDIRGHDLITEIPPFDDLIRIEGDLQVTNMSGLTSFDAFNNLEYVGTQIQIRVNGQLQKLSGFDRLDTIGTSLSIDGNTILDTLDAFRSLDYLGGDLSAFGIDSLRVFDTFDSLDYLGGTVQLYNMIELENMPDFMELDSIGGDLLLLNFPKLNSLSSFPSLELVDGSIYIVDFKRLKDIDGLLSVYDNQGTVAVSSNDSLQSIAGLRNLRPEGIKSPFGGNDLELIDNPILDYCSVKSVCQVIEDPASVVSVSGNGLDCNTVDAIEDKCCPSELVIAVEPNSGIYESLGDIIIRANVHDGAVLDLRHGAGGEVRIEEDVFIDPSVTIIISEVGCQY